VTDLEEARQHVVNAVYAVFSKRLGRTVARIVVDRAVQRVIEELTGYRYH